ncbi:hypothetical protein [Aeromonas caviae]|uniref:hypothetical protein n=1 Tax=Aeromonas caviae TaxID=648 RepID=UPI0038CFA5C7
MSFGQASWAGRFSLTPEINPKGVVKLLDMNNKKMHNSYILQKQKNDLFLIQLNDLIPFNARKMRFY